MKLNTFTIIAGIITIVGLIAVLTTIQDNNIEQLWKSLLVVSFAVVCITYGGVLYEDNFRLNPVKRVI